MPLSHAIAATPVCSEIVDASPSGAVWVLSDDATSGSASTSELLSEKTISALCWLAARNEKSKSNSNSPPHYGKRGCPTSRSP